MAGIYIHIPFCTKKCSYCDFYSIVSFAQRASFIKALIKEISQRKNDLQGEEIATIYFGGGTPSLLTKQELASIFDAIYENYSVKKDAEITLEANPEDINKDYLKDLQYLSINRLSIGLQSFVERDLQMMNRRHTAQKSIISVEMAYASGFDNISVDLIYGLPNATIQEWEQNLEQVFSLPISHLSAYHLTYEKGTLLYKRKQQNRIALVEEEQSLAQFKRLHQKVKEYGFSYYEISNFAKEKKYAQHNLSYWQQKKYLGFGPSAHSFDGENRRWNLAKLKTYIEGVMQEKEYFEKEYLSNNDHWNDYLITALRTRWGINKQYVQESFDTSYFLSLKKEIQSFIKTQDIKETENQFVLTAKGIFISDFILEKLILV